MRMTELCENKPFLDTCSVALLSWPDTLNLISILVYFRVVKNIPVENNVCKLLLSDTFIHCLLLRSLQSGKVYFHPLRVRDCNLKRTAISVINYLQRTKFTKHYDLKHFLNHRSLEQTSSFTFSFTDRVESFVPCTACLRH